MPNEIERLRAYQNTWLAHEQFFLGPPENRTYFNMRVTPLYNWRGKLHGRMIVLRDVSELHQREMALQQAKNELESANSRLVGEMISRETAQSQVLEQQCMLATLNERERLACDLHDGLGQVLGFVHLQVQAARKILMDGDLYKADAHLQRIAQVAYDAQLQIRETIHLLKFQVPLERRFFPALGARIERFEHDYNIRVVLEIDPGVNRRGFDLQISTQLLNIIQEALNNAGKYSGASNILVRFCEQGDLAEISINDDGCGFDTSSTINEKEHFGLLFMRERVQQVGGSLCIESRLGGGTDILLHVPLREPIQGEIV